MQYKVTVKKNINKLFKSEYKRLDYFNFCEKNFKSSHLKNLPNNP
jgi:hypothetical protein